ncbi:MAG: hypothetical protein FWG78_00800 [Coriobacteriia bacterium]|nr:hypothetical protein [Coriobacteriia bacterium]
MKKVLLTLALAAMLVFAFASVAGAKYAGYAIDGNRDRNEINSETGTVNSPQPGFLSWGGAIRMQDASGFTAAATAPGAPGVGNVHGGYAIASSKCFVCHSAHRAGVATTRASLTMGGAACGICHTVWGGGGANKKVEYNRDEMRPHSSADTTCHQCHGGGIHGGGGSEFAGMNMFLIGGRADSLIRAEIGADAADNSKPNQIPSGLTAARTWFFDNAPASSDAWTIPTGLNRQTWSVAKGTVTGMTCNRSGCHTNSVFAINEWGVGATRNVSSSNLGAAMGGTDTNTDPIAHTGHINPGRYRNTGGDDCAPCHAGNVSAGFRMRTVAGYEDAEPVGVDGDRSTAYGCDQCHDMVGVQTGTTAFPHGNRVAVYEWDDNGAAVTTTSTAGNLWMYAGNIAQISTVNSTWSTWRQADGITAPAGSRVPSPVDPSFRVINGAVGSNNDGTAKDGACLKCHITTDDASFYHLVGSYPATVGPDGFRQALTPAAVGTRHQNRAIGTYFNATTTTGTAWQNKTVFDGTNLASVRDNGSDVIWIFR